jgi:hypothetical protein
MPIKFDIVPGETEHITLRGVIRRNPTLLMRVRTPKKTFSLSRKALLLGATLILCQILDGILTYTGLLLLGVEMEGNGLIRDMIYAYGLVPGICMAKVGALLSVALITIAAHRRKWIRPIILLLSAVYVTLALVPWTLVLWYRL